LLFEPGFIRALMALGQADVAAKSDEILSFLTARAASQVR
jgi:NTE family protein